MDNFSCSHRGTSYVRLWSGARQVFKHLRVPLVSFSEIWPSCYPFFSYPDPNNSPVYTS